jgi:hypothetical protein
MNNVADDHSNVAMVGTHDGRQTTARRPAAQDLRSPQLFLVSTLLYFSKSGTENL